MNNNIKLWHFIIAVIVVCIPVIVAFGNLPDKVIALEEKYTNIEQKISDVADDVAAVKHTVDEVKCLLKHDDENEVDELTACLLNGGE